jgi:hypothetical protein
MKCMARVEVCSQLMLRAFIEANARCVILLYCCRGSLQHTAYCQRMSVL